MISKLVDETSLTEYAYIKRKGGRREYVKCCNREEMRGLA
jgi:hypothetical protein